MKFEEGYKLTEIGLIPEDWDKKKLGEVLTLQRGFDLPHRNRVAGVVPIISSAGNCGTHKDFLAEGPGVVTGRYGTIGEVFYVEKNYWPLNTTLFVKSFKNNYPRYIYYLLKTIDFKTHSGKSGVPGVNRNDLHEIIIPHPPTKAEQTAIATVLSDTDTLISRLETLIEKKRVIKQGAMQQLLKPKEDWVEKSLGEVCFPSKSRIDPTSSTNYKCIELEHLSQESGRLLGTVDSIGLKSQKSTFTKGDVLFGKLRPYLKKYLYAEFDGVCTTEIWVLKAFQGVNSRWLFYLVQTDKIIEAANLSTGTKMPRAEWKTVSNTIVYLPLPKEQIAIAQILSDLDTEIAGLEQKLTKYKLLKQGMMQELLTGKTRLV